MLVVKVEMWPGGDAAKARVISMATWTCLGVARDHGDRGYKVRLFKDADFGGPTVAPVGEVWREGTVRGHFPGRRGVWDLLAAGLREVVGRRLEGYRAIEEKDLPGVSK